MRKGWTIAAVALLVAAGTAWYFGSPAWTLKRMASAAQARDTEELSSYIDYPKLRETTKSQLKAAMTAELTSDSTNGFEALGLMMGMSMVDNMIDGVLSPEGMEAMFAAEKNEAATTRKPAVKKPFGLDASNRVVIRDGLDKFRLHEQSSPGQDGDLVFERHGLSWRLAEIKVPTGLFDEKK
jgi:hypothetical protein